MFRQKSITRDLTILFLSVLLPFSNKGVMLASFQRCGNLPVENDLLKRKHRGDDKTLAHSFRMRGGKLSGPGDL